MHADEMPLLKVSAHSFSMTKKMQQHGEPFRVQATLLGEKAAERIFKLEPENSGMSVLLSNLNASSGRWSEVNKMRLNELDLRMKKEGYVSKAKLVLHDVEKKEKEHMLKYHSEKLAVAFGILTIPDGRSVTVIKNLRVCEAILQSNTYQDCGKVDYVTGF
ncbi:DYW domain [Dillenia turbinata]|uniref:DYW domain n=1 Tax=Dillenia turbinata TaxID=194707 RepID=A0AAN8V0V5_9MAGN